MLKTSFGYGRLEMKSPYVPMVGMHVALTEQWVQMAMCMFKWYSGVLDPRPDLARPARGHRAAYAWWW